MSTTIRLTKKEKQLHELNGYKRDSIAYWSLIRLLHNQPYQVINKTYQLGSHYYDAIEIRFPDREVTMYIDEERHLRVFTCIDNLLVNLESDIFNLMPIYKKYAR